MPKWLLNEDAKKREGRLLWDMSRESGIPELLKRSKRSTATNRMEVFSLRSSIQIPSYPLSSQQANRHLPLLPKKPCHYHKSPLLKTLCQRCVPHLYAISLYPGTNLRLASCPLQGFALAQKRVSASDLPPLAATTGQNQQAMESCSL